MPQMLVFQIVVFFKGHGRWSSEFGKDGYVKDSFLTSISKALGTLVFSFVTLLHLF